MIYIQICVGLPDGGQDDLEREDGDAHDAHPAEDDVVGLLEPEVLEILQ